MSSEQETTATVNATTEATDSDRTNLRLAEEVAEPVNPLDKSYDSMNS